MSFYQHPAPLKITIRLLGGISGGSTDQLEGGLTVLVRDFGTNESPGHIEFLDDNIIYKSSVLIRPIHALQPARGETFLAEITKALSGLRNNGGYPNFPYTDFGTYVNDGVRAIRLNNLLPSGFWPSTQGIPRVIIQEHPQDTTHTLFPLCPIVLIIYF